MSIDLVKKQSNKIKSIGQNMTSLWDFVVIVQNCTNVFLGLGWLIRIC